MKKVTAKNLMIGDWVKYKRRYRQVKALTLKDFFGNRTIELSVYPEPTVATATPIPITEEWLKLNGWEIFNPRELVYYNGIKRMFYSFSEKRFSNDGFNAPNIQYIHQLQQAYRLATGGKELKVKF
jgi:hypothetical protein